MKILAVIATSLLFAAPVFAQSVGEKSGVYSALGVSPSTADFVKEAAIGDMFEIQSSQLAAQRANEPTKAFASQMITDHQKTANELKSMVQSGRRRRAFHPTLTALTRKCWTSSRAWMAPTSRNNIVRTRSALIRTPYPCLGDMQKAGDDAVVERLGREDVA